MHLGLYTFNAFRPVCHYAFMPLGLDACVPLCIYTLIFYAFMPLGLSVRMPLIRYAVVPLCCYAIKP